MSKANNSKAKNNDDKNLVIDNIKSEGVAHASLLQFGEIKGTKKVRKTKLTPDQLAMKRKRKIAKLLAKKDIKYRGPLSYRSVRILGFVFLILAQAVLCYSFVKKFISMPQWTDGMFNFFEIISAFSLPMFLMVNFTIIMSSKKKIINYLITYTALALMIYLGIIFVYYRYLNGICVSISDTFEEGVALADTIAKQVFGKVINYNIFVDLSLFSLFFFFFFYSPKKIKTKKGILWFRLCSIIPLLIAVTSFIIYGHYFIGDLNLPVALLAIMPCRSIGIYAIFVVISFTIKLRKYLFIKWGGSEEQYEIYARSSRSSFEVSVFSAITIVVVSILDLSLLLIYPRLLLNGVGLTAYMIFIAPILFLFSYTRVPKKSAFDTYLPFIAFGIIAICYLEAILFVMTAS